MRKLTRHEKSILSNIFEELCKCNMFIGEYDAKNGNIDFMYGVGTVMETLACMISGKKADEFSTQFFENMENSEKRGNEK